MKFCLAQFLQKCLPLTAALFMFYGIPFTPACRSMDEANLTQVNQLRRGLESGSFFAMHRAIQESMAHTIDHPETLALTLKTVMQSEDGNGQMLALMELSRVGPGIVRMLMEELRVLKSSYRMHPLLVCLGRIGPEAKAAIPVLTNLLNNRSFDEAFRIELRVVLANLGHQAPGFLEQLAADVGTTNRTSPRPLEGIAVHAMALIGVREWVNGEITLQVVKLLKGRGSFTVPAVITLACSGKGQSNAINALREMHTTLKDEASWDSARAVLGFARYRIETKDREACLRDGLQYLGSQPIGGEQFLLLIGLYHCLMDDELLQRLIEHLEEQETPVRVGAIRALAGVGLPGKKAVPRLFDLAIKSTSEEERLGAFITIGTMAEADRIPELEQCLQREEKVIFKYAIEHSLKCIKHEYPSKWSN